MLFEIPNILAICRVDSFPSRYSVSAAAAVEEAFVDNPFGLPPILPLARAAFNQVSRQLKYRLNGCFSKGHPALVFQPLFR